MHVRVSRWEQQHQRAFADTTTILGHGIRNTVPVGELAERLGKLRNDARLLLPEIAFGADCFSASDLSWGHHISLHGAFEGFGCGDGSFCGDHVGGVICQVS